MIKRYVPVYLNSLKIASDQGEMNLWVESTKENARCANKMMELMGNTEENHSIDEKTFELLSEEFGLQRFTFVTVSSLNLEGPNNVHIDWADKFFTPLDENECKHFRLPWNEGFINDFATNLREFIREKSFFYEENQCDSMEDYHGYVGEVVAIKRKEFGVHYQAPEHQLELVLSCDDSSKIFPKLEVVSLCDGTTNSRKPESICGIVKEEFLPDWAIEEMEQYREDSAENYER